MGRVALSAPQALIDAIKARGLNLSELFRAAARAALECDHPDGFECGACGERVTEAQLIERWLTRFYLDVMDEHRALVSRGGTAEGAARAVQEVGRRYKLRVALESPLPRPTRAERSSSRLLSYEHRDRHQGRPGAGSGPTATAGEVG